MTALMRGRETRSKGVRILSALSAGTKRNESHESNDPLSHRHLHPHSDNMGLRDGIRNLLSLPRKDRRARSEARGRDASIADPGEVGQVVPRPAESSPDLRIGPSTSPAPGPLTSRDHESSSMPTSSFRVFHLTTPPRNTDRPAVLGQIRSVMESGQSKNQKSSDDKTTDSSAAHENVSNWKSTAYSTTKLAINLVKESSDVFPPLKSVVGGLSAILEHCDVQPISPIPYCP